LVASLERRAEEEEALMASNTGVRTELYRDQFGVLLEDLDRRMLELKWLDGSSSMTDDDFKAWLDRFREGSPGATGSPAPEPPGNFPTGYFDTPAKIEAWFKG
jgi:hypothetical protein